MLALLDALEKLTAIHLFLMSMQRRSAAKLTLNYSKVTSGKSACYQMLVRCLKKSCLMKLMETKEESFSNIKSISPGALRSE